MYLCQFDDNPNNITTLNSLCNMLIFHTITIRFPLRYIDLFYFNILLHCSKPTLHLPASTPTTNKIISHLLIFYLFFIAMFLLFQTINITPIRFSDNHSPQHHFSTFSSGIRCPPTHLQQEVCISIYNRLFLTTPQQSTIN